MKVRLGILREYLQEHYETFLIEGRVEDAREKYPDLSDEDFEFLVANQPAGSNNKYLLWACARAEELLENDPDRTALQVVTQAIRLFDGNKQRLQKKDLYQYKTPAEVEEAVEKLGGASKNQKAQQARADTDVIHNDDRFMVLRPHTTEASCKYGIGTKWCIAATASRNYYSTYSQSNNKFYFVIDKTAEAGTPNSKFAIVILEPVGEDTSRIQVFNASDRQVGLKAVVNHVGEKWPEIWGKIKAHVAKNPDTREVEEARKTSEELVKSLLKGDKVGNEGLKKIARDATLTSATVKALVKVMRERTGPRDYTDPSGDIIAQLSNRASELPPDGAFELLKFIPTLKPAEDRRYWSGNYHLRDIAKKAPLTPEAFRELVQTADDDILIMLVDNPNIPDEIVQSLASRMGELQSRELKKQVYRALIKKGTITVEQMRAAMEMDGTGYGGLAYEILYYPEMSSKLSPDLLRLVPVRHGEDLKKFLALSNVPPDLAADLISRYWSQLSKPDLYELLRNVELPTEMIERIWTDKDQYIRVSLLQNPGIGVENAKKFAGSRNSAYRFAVAHNPILPGEDLQILAGDESASTRAAVGANPNTPPETLRVLASDEAVVVRASVATNAKAGTAVLSALKRDSDEFVRKSARQTLKSMQTAEEFIRVSLSMRGSLLKEEMNDDDDMVDIMTPDWRQIPGRAVELQEFVAIVLLQNNGSATREEIEEAFEAWPGRTRYHVGGYSRESRRSRTARGTDIWSLIRKKEKYGNRHARTTTSMGKGWFWSPPGMNKGSIYRLTPTGASAAMSVLKRLRQEYPEREWGTRTAAPVRRSPPPAELTPGAQAQAAAPRQPGAPRGPKTTYKIYGRFKGHPVATRLKGQAYVGAAGTQFSAGEQAEISPTDDGKLKVKKVNGDHTQTWEPIDG